MIDLRDLEILIQLSSPTPCSQIESSLSRSAVRKRLKKLKKLGLVKEVGSYPKLYVSTVNLKKHPELVKKICEVLNFKSIINMTLSG